MLAILRDPQFFVLFYIYSTNKNTVSNFDYTYFMWWRLLKNTTFLFLIFNAFLSLNHIKGFPLIKSGNVYCNSILKVKIHNFYEK